MFSVGFRLDRLTPHALLTLGLGSKDLFFSSQVDGLQPLNHNKQKCKECVPTTNMHVWRILMFVDGFSTLLDWFKRKSKEKKQPHSLGSLFWRPAKICPLMFVGCFFWRKWMEETSHQNSSISNSKPIKKGRRALRFCALRDGPKGWDWTAARTSNARKQSPNSPTVLHLPEKWLESCISGYVLRVLGA